MQSRGSGTGNFRDVGSDVYGRRVDDLCRLFWDSRGQARHCIGKLSVNLRVRVGELNTFEAGLPFRGGGEVR